MNTTPNTAKNAPKPIISDEVEAELTRAYVTILRLMNTYGETIAPTLEKAGRQEWERGASRGLNALTALQAHRKEQEVAAFRQGVKDAISPHLDTARADKEQYDALPASLRARVGAFQTFILVPVSDMSGVFGEGVPEAEQVLKLQKMGYKVSKSAQGSYSVRVDLPKSILGETAA